MSEERTGSLSGGRSFEERVFARFDALDARFNFIQARFDAMDARFNAMEARFDKVDAHLEKVDARLDKVDARLDKVDARLERVEGSIDSLDSRVQALEARALDTKPIWERALAEILNIKERVTKIERHFEVVAIDMVRLRSDQRQVNLRLDNLESKSA